MMTMVSIPSRSLDARSHFCIGGLCWSLMLAGIVAMMCAPSYAADAPRVTSGRLRLQLERIVDRPPSSVVSFPIYMDTANDHSGRMFFMEQPGRVRVRQPDGTFSTFLDITSETLIAGGQRGLLGMTFHPDFADSQSPGFGKFYTYHSVDPAVVPGTPDFTSTGTVSNDNVVTEWQVDAQNPNVIDMSSRREVFREAHVGGPTNIHQGGMLDFGPDGYLYGTIGTPPDGSALRLLAQDMTSIQGKIFRIDPLDPGSTTGSADSVSSNGKYRVPADNPFVDTPSALGEIYALGIRHIHRFGWDSENGNFFVGDVGDAHREEVALVNAGDNHGYPYYEGTLTTAFAIPDPPPTFTPPMVEYSHADGRTVVGGSVYRGSIEALQGVYFAGEFSWSGNNAGFLCCAGRLFYSEPYDSMGELKEQGSIRLYEALSEPSTCATTISTSNGCTIDNTLFSLAMDEDGEIYTVGASSNRAVVYKITGGYFLPEGDYNEDGKVDAADYTVWRDTLGQSVLYQPNPQTQAAMEGYGTKADGDGDGVVDMDDYAIWKAHFGESVDIGLGAGSLAVPEPTSLLLAALGCIAIGLRTRRPCRC